MVFQILSPRRVFWTGSPGAGLLVAKEKANWIEAITILIGQHNDGYPGFSCMRFYSLLFDCPQNLPTRCRSPKPLAYSANSTLSTHKKKDLVASILEAAKFKLFNCFRSAAVRTPNSKFRQEDADIARFALHGGVP